MRFWMKLFWILIPGLFATLLYFCLIPLKEGDALLVVDGSEEILEYTDGPGYVFEWKTLFPWKFQVLRFTLRNRVSNVHLSVDLSSGLFPESSPEGKVKIKLEVKYSLDGQEATEFLEIAGIRDEKISNYISKLLYSLLRKKIEEYQNNPALLKANLENYIKNELSSDLLKEEKPLKTLNLRILDLQVPDATLVNGIYRNQNILLQRKLELVAALGKAEALKIEEDAKTSALLKRLEKTKDFVTKNPDMKEFVLYETLSDHVEVILLPSEMILGEIPTSKKKKNGAVKRPKEVE
ncbi:hypothetical protein [Leptospira stimsonii]|uniref:Band 7 domain-containing protein n=1 Tax=Leptospira stimsonii TaxID=2202203 RepID=A0A4V3JUL8_9LEPT|nr:hypothetical protein [Leptospira stimsonii]RHX86275.1 hypothetical protein DLM78_10550 [Leptospira stimsonii]TGK14597.1 hypothetical protein EHO98_17235 [Leptospira stimsonii]TGM10020.1 hypothetical protein EHQ90_20190 [Leptospira stimsonii]